VRNQVGFDRESAEDRALYQGTTFSRAAQSQQRFGLQPLRSSSCPARGGPLGLLLYWPFQGLKPKFLSILYGPTKVVP
jgi:hypothetical protein